MVSSLGDDADPSAMVGGRDDPALNLDRAPGRGHRRHQQGRQMTDPNSGSARRGGRAAAAEEGQAATACRAPAGAAGEAEHLGDEAERAERRRDRGQLAGDPAQLAAEALAADTVAHVPARGGARAQATIVALHKLLADQLAGGVPRVGGLRQGDPGAYEQRLDGSDRDSQRDREIGIGHPGQLPHEQSRTLLLRQAADVLDQPPE